MTTRRMGLLALAGSRQDANMEKSPARRSADSGRKIHGLPGDTRQFRADMENLRADVDGLRTEVASATK